MGSKLTSSDNLKWTIDRFEENKAVLENSKTLEMVSIPISRLPANANPGDILMFKNDTWHFDHAETEVRKAQISELFQRIKQKNL